MHAMKTINLWNADASPSLYYLRNKATVTPTPDQEKRKTLPDRYVLSLRRPSAVNGNRAPRMVTQIRSGAAAGKCRSIPRVDE